MGTCKRTSVKHSRLRITTLATTLLYRDINKNTGDAGFVRQNFFELKNAASHNSRHVIGVLSCARPRVFQIVHLVNPTRRRVFWELVAICGLARAPCRRACHRRKLWSRFRPRALHRRLFWRHQSFFRRWFSTPLVAGAREGNALLLQSSSRKCRNVNMKAASVSWWLSVAWHVRLAVGLAIGRERILAEFRVFMLSPFFCNFYWSYSFM